MQQLVSATMNDDGTLREIFDDINSMTGATERFEAVYPNYERGIYRRIIPLGPNHPSYQKED